MGMVRQKVSEVLGLSLQAFDGSTSLFPQVILRDSSGALLTTLDLTHAGDGLYINRSFLMPNQALVTATYKVYEDAGHTTLDTNYQESMDVFVRDETASQQGIVDGTIVGTVDDSEDLVGVVDLGNYDPVLVGTVEETMLVGVVDDDPVLVGTVAGDEVVGILLQEEN